MILEPSRSGRRVRGSGSGAGSRLIEVHFRYSTWL